MIRKTCFLVLLLFAACVADAADFQPTLLHLDAQPVIQYDFDGSQLSIPVQVSGTSAGILFSVFTKDYAPVIPYTVNGYLGWHMVNKVDTCVYYSPLMSVGPGETVITWDGRNQDGGNVPPGEYTYYLWAFDNQGAKQQMSEHLNAGWAFDYTTKVQEVDENGLPMANPIWYRHEERWLIGNDPTDGTLLETCLLSDVLPTGWSLRGDPTMHPTDFNYVYVSVGNSDTKQGSIMKYRWIPNGAAEIQSDWGESQGFATIFSTNGGSSPGTCTDGEFLYSGDENHVASTEPDADFYIYDFDGFMVAEIDLTPWWSNPDDLEAGGQMNGGPNNFDERNGMIILNCHCNCLNQMVDPLRWLDSEEYDDFFVWSNGNGDYTLDHNFEDTAMLPWICNDYNVGPYKYSVSPDDNLFSVVNAYDVGAVSFGLLGPDGTGLGYYSFAGETAGWKKGQIIVDSDTPFDGMYCDDQKTTGWHYDSYGDQGNSGIYFIGHDSIKGVITTTGVSYLSLTSPNGGENILRRTGYSISWASWSIDYITIEFSSDNGITWTTLAERIPASQKSYAWTVPVDVSDNCLIRITDSDNPTLTDTSSRTFSIVRPIYPGRHFALEVENTGNNATLMIPVAAGPAVNGVPIESGDEIAVFTPRGICAGMDFWNEENLALTLWGDDPQDDGTLGFIPGDPIVIKVWDASEEKEFLVEAVYDKGDGTYTGDGIFIIGSLDTQSVDFAEPLANGWNIVSLAVYLEDYTLSVVLSGVENDLVLVKDGGGRVYWPEYGVDTIDEWCITDGYQFYMRNAAELAVTGYDVFSPDIEYALPKDWSLIGYVGGDGLSSTAAFEPVLDRLIVVKNAEGDVFWPEYEIDDIGGLVRGEGYWVYLSAPASFSFPASAAKPAAPAPVAKLIPRHFTPVSNTGANSVVLLKAGTVFDSGGGRLSTGDEIGVFTESGLCAGAAVWTEGRSLAVTFWGDNEFTDKTDGLAVGETFRFVLWDADTGRETDAAPVFASGLSVFEPNGLAVLGSLGAEAGASADGSAGPQSFSLAQNSPNPFNPTTAIAFTLPRECRAVLTVYNIAGEKVAVLADGVLPAGGHTVEWNADGLSSGVYFYRLTAGPFEESRRMVLVK